MKFNNGYFGACIVVLALLGTAISGFVLNIERDTREVTNYDYIADVSGLFDYTDAPEYIDYNPSTNYVGYSGDFTFTPASVPNNYRYIVAEGETGTKTLTIDSSSSFSNDFITGLPTNGFHSHLISYTGSYDFGNMYHSSSQYGKNTFNGYAVLESASIPSVTKLTNVLNAVDLTGIDSGTITITNTGDVPLFCILPDTWYFKNSVTVGTARYYYMADLNDSLIPTSIKFETTSMLVIVYHNSDVIYNGPADGIGILYKYHVAKYWDSNSNPINWRTISPVSSLSTNYQMPPTYGYMEPRAGVKPGMGGTWSNGYENGVIDIKIIKNGDSSTTPPQNCQITFPDNKVLGFAYNGTDFVYILGGVTDQTAETVSLGSWLGVQLRIDALNGKIILTPTNDLDLLSTVEPTSYSITIDDYISAGAINSLTISRGTPADNSLKLQVTDTRVFLNTYNTVMIDPSLNIQDYFPSYTDYRLNLYSFAVLGDSLTINNQTMNVNRSDGTFTFTNIAGLSFTKKLANFNITFNEGHTFLNFVNENASYDLGETLSTVVSFSGMWYFTTGLYKANPGLETYWNLDLDGMFHATAGECLLIFIGIIGAGIIVYTVWGRGKLGAFDWLVVIFAVFLGSCVLGF